MNEVELPVGYSVPDWLWEKIEPLLPKHINPHPEKGGRPRTPDRKALNGILFVLRTGCQWNALNTTGICSSSVAHDRFQEWRRAGVFRHLWADALKEYDRQKGIKWRWQAMDGELNKAPLGGEKNRAKPHRSSQKRRQAKSSVRRMRRSHKLGSRRGESPRHEAYRSDA